MTAASLILFVLETDFLSEIIAHLMYSFNLLHSRSQLTNPNKGKNPVCDGRETWYGGKDKSIDGEYSRLSIN